MIVCLDSSGPERPGEISVVAKLLPKPLEMEGFLEFRRKLFSEPSDESIQAPGDLVGV